MATTAQAPAAHFPHAQAPRRSVRHVPVDERVSVLEARWEQTIPELATHRDISDLRSEIIKWVVGAGIALFAAFAALFIANTARIDALAARQDTRMDALDAKLDRLDAKMDSRFDALMAEIRALRRAE